MTKTVQTHYMNFNIHVLACLWNKLPQHNRMSNGLSSFKRQLGVLYKLYLIDFDINNRCAPKNSTARLTDDSDVRTEVLAVDEPQCPTFTIIMFW